jgi:ankyrin repeat protein
LLDLWIPETVEKVRSLPLLKTLFGLVLALLAISGCAEPDRPTVSLYRAVHAGDIDQLERHLYWGSDINVPGADGDMPLHVASRRGRLVIARLLLDSGAEVDALNRDGRTPLYVALMKGRTQLADLLVERGAQLKPDWLLLEVARNGVADRDVIRFLVDKGGDIDNRDPNGETALHIAVRGGERAVAQYLIRQGADVNALSGSGETPLDLAIQQGETYIARLLERNGAVASQ